MENKIYATLSFVGIWMLYIFPLYQGVLEMSEQQRIIKKFDEAYKEFPHISNWYWLFPPLKIRKEKRRAISILKNKMSDQSDYNALLTFLNKSLVWIYIALAGLLNGIVATDGFVKALFKNPDFILVILVDILMIIIGLIHAYYRVTDKRKNRELNKLKRMFKK